MAASHRTPTDRVLAKARHVLTAAGFDEAMTLSVVEEPWSEAFSPWTDAAALRSTIPVSAPGRSLASQFGAQPAGGPPNE